MPTTQTPIFTDTFNRANAPSLGPNWLDPNGVASLVGDQAVWTSTNQAYQGAGVVAAANPATLQDGGVTLSIPANFTGQAAYLVLRGQGGWTTAGASLSAYVVGLSPGDNEVEVYAVAGGVVNTLSPSPNIAITGGYQAGHAYTLDASAVGINPTTIRFTLTDTTTGTVVASGSATDSTAALQAAGFTGGFVNEGAGPLVGFANYAIGSGPTPSFTINPTSIVTGEAFTATLTGTNTNWTTSTGFTCTVPAGMTGYTLTSASVNVSAQTATVGVATGTGTGTLVFGDTTDAAQAPVAITAAPATGGNPVTLGVAGIGHWCPGICWDDNGTGTKQANGVRTGATLISSANPGAESRWRWTTPATAGVVAQLLVDTTDLAAGGVPLASYPLLKYRINEGAYFTQQVQAGTNGTFTLDVTGAGVSGAGTYTLHVFLMATDQGQPRWTPVGSSFAAPMSLKIAGLVVDPGSTPVAPFVLPGTVAVFGDSITEGVRASGTANGDIASNDSTLVYARGLAEERGCELAPIGFGAQGWTRAGNGGVPTFPAAFGFYAAGRPRDFSVPVSEVFIVHGANDGLNGVADSTVAAAAAAFLATARTTFGAAPIRLTVPFGGFCRHALTVALGQYQASTADPRTTLADCGPAIQLGLTGPVSVATKAAIDSVHPNTPTHGRIGATLAVRSSPPVTLSPADEAALAADLGDEPALLAATTALAGMVTTLGTNLATVTANLATVQATIATLPTTAALATALAGPLAANVVAIDGSAAAAVQLQADELATAIPASILTQLVTTYLASLATAPAPGATVAAGSVAANAAAAAALVLPAGLTSTAVETAVQAALVAAPPLGTVPAAGSVLGVAAAAQAGATAAATAATSAAAAAATAATVAQAVRTKTDALLVEAGTGAVILAAAGLEDVMVEPGINLRQALAVIQAASGGPVTGAGATSGNGPANVAAPQASGTAAPAQRIAATMSNGTRTGVVLTLPAVLPAPVGV